MSEVLLAQLETGKPPKPAKLLAALRELSVQLNQDTEGTSFTPQFAAALAGLLLPQLRDTDNDSRELARLVHFFITEIVARHARVKNVAARLLEAVLDDLHAATYFPRQLIAIQSIGVLSTHYYAQYGLSVVLQQEKVYRATLELVRRSNVDLQRLSFALLRGGGSDARSKQKKELMESLALSGALALMISQVLAATKSESGPPEWMAYLYTVAFATESLEVNHDAARAGHAAILELASKTESTRSEIAVHLYSNQKLLPSAVIPDVLACVSYLRLCACIAFSTGAGGSHAVRETFFRILSEAALNEKRLPVTLEAITLLFQPLMIKKNMCAEFKRMIDVSSIARLLCQALQQKQAPSTTIHAVLYTTHLVAQWLVLHQEEDEEHATANLSLTMLATGGGTHRVHAGVLKQLREMVLHKSGLLESRQLLSAPLPLAVLRALIWLVPSMPPPTLTSNNTSAMFSSSAMRLVPALSLSGTVSLSGTGGGGGSVAAAAAAIPLPAGTSPEASMWQSLEGRLREAPTNLTDAQLALLLAEGRKRLQVQAISSSSASTRLLLVPLLLNTAFNYVVAVPSDDISEAVFKMWECLLRLLATQPAHQTEVLAAILHMLDYAQCPNQCNGSTAAASTAAASTAAAAASVVRQVPVWQAQGQSQPPTFPQRRAACTRLVRLACWFLGEHALHFFADRLGAIILRLQTLGLYSDCFTRSMALGALCKIAVCCESLDLKVSLYEYLHGLEKADFDIDLERKSPARERSRSNPSLGVAAAAVGTQQEQEQQKQQALLASLDAGSGGGLKGDYVGATLVHLRGVFREHLRSMGVNPPADGAADAVLMDASLFVVREGQRN